MAKVFVARELAGDALSRLEDAGHTTTVWPGRLPPHPTELREAVADAEGLLTTLTERVDAALLDAAPRLRVVANYAIGHDNIDLAATSQRQIPVGVTPDVLTDATADLTFALLLAAARRLPEAAAAVRDGRWRTFETQGWLGADVAGQTIAIVGGAGRIGSAVARRARGFDMRTLVVGRDDDLHQALRQADFVSLHAPLTPQTRHLIDAEALTTMKPGAILVNTGRGGLIDQDALREALHSGHLAAAALDVTDPEPLPPDDPLLRAPNLLVLPHIGSATHTARAKMTSLAVDNLLAGLAGQPLPTPPEAGSPMRIAVIDVGTNSTRLAIVDVTDGRIAAEIERRTTITRLGQGVDHTGVLADEAMARVEHAIDAYKKIIDAHAVDAVTTILTSAVRDARNGPAFTARLNDTYAIDARTITGDEEARLTYLGATSDRDHDRDVHPDAPTVVIDVGGGSTELVVGQGADVRFHVSTQAGVVRQTERFLKSDPPAPEELQLLQQEAEEIFAAAVPAAERVPVAKGIAVAGTATSCASILQELEPYDPAKVHGFRLLRAQAEMLLARLAQLTVAERREVKGLHPDRAEAIVAGVILLIEALRTFDLDEVEVSEHDILRGAALDRSCHGGTGEG